VYEVVGLRAVAEPIVGSSSSNMRTDCMSNSSCSAPTCDDPTLHLYMYVIRRGMNELTNFMQKLVKYLWVNESKARAPHSIWSTEAHGGSEQGHKPQPKPTRTHATLQMILQKDGKVVPRTFCQS
jgi:hypothetical protein